eukprot:CAMPEP_0174885838 /NCGR_PEP_ID=MMETSP0167-20121228/1109_1 /TAXON_ID=38298 /ORGANISM="Rhodella maculata, Strain CCMP736" /LENGTH=59 /DNA_ID=CAMNT_0016121565 /DNA_START=328 /DNA_END=504 /DNA_ORIENTATION=+
MRCIILMDYPHVPPQPSKRPKSPATHPARVVFSLLVDQACVSLEMTEPRKLGGTFRALV